MIKLPPKIPIASTLAGAVWMMCAISEATESSESDPDSVSAVATLCVFTNEDLVNLLTYGEPGEQDLAIIEFHKRGRHAIPHLLKIVENPEHFRGLVFSWGVHDFGLSEGHPIPVGLVACYLIDAALEESLFFAAGPYVKLRNSGEGADDSKASDDHPHLAGVSRAFSAWGREFDVEGDNMRRPLEKSAYAWKMRPKWR